MAMENFHVHIDAKGMEVSLYRGKRVRARSNGLNAKSTILFNNFCECPWDFWQLL